jgi:hypothetical protein
MGVTGRRQLLLSAAAAGGFIVVSCSCSRHCRRCRLLLGAAAGSRRCRRRLLLGAAAAGHHRRRRLLPGAAATGVVAFVGCSWLQLNPYRVRFPARRK